MVQSEAGQHPVAIALQHPAAISLDRFVHLLMKRGNGVVIGFKFGRVRKGGGPDKINELDGQDAQLGIVIQGDDFGPAKTAKPRALMQCFTA